MAPVAEMLGARVRRVVYLSSEGIEREADSLWGVVEDAVREHVPEWTMLRPTGFARNAEQWAEQIHGGGAVRWPFGEMARPVIHEADMAAVAVEALLGDDLVGRSVVLTGPELISQREQVDAIGAAVGRTVPWVEIGRDEAEQELDLPGFMLDAWAEMVTSPEPVTDGVACVLGRPATPFARWAQDNAALFRP